MAEVLGILGGLYTTAEILSHIAEHTTKWRTLSERLFDLKEGLDAAELSLKSWQRRYDIQDRRHVQYVLVLFGHEGWKRIQQTLGSIEIISDTIRQDVDKVVGRALAAKPRRAPERLNGGYDKKLVQECLQRIRQNTSWSRKFKYSVLGRIDDLEWRLDRLQTKLTRLEWFSESFLEKEHPEVFHPINRLPGRRVIRKISSTELEAAKNKLLDAVSARKDAGRLMRAAGQGNRVHIGLSVPRIHRRDFAFLFELEGRTHEILVHPVRIKEFTDKSRVQPNMMSVVPALISNVSKAHYLLPSDSRSAGFQVSIPPSNMLQELEYKDSLYSIIRDQKHFLSQQVLYPHDQIGLACSIALGSFRLIGSRWLQSMDCKNVRWRRGKDGQWTSMMAAVPGDAATARTLDKCMELASQRRDKRDLSKHVQVFRIGIVIAEIALKRPISYIDCDSLSGIVKIYMNRRTQPNNGAITGEEEEVDAEEVASEVETKTSNSLLANIVFSCLSVLQDKMVLADRDIEGRYYREVVKVAEELESVSRSRRENGGGGSGVATPRSGASVS